MPLQDNKKNNDIKTITRCAILSAVALTIFMIEAQIPMPVMIPGIKLGLSNIVTLYAMFTLGKKPALFVLITRIFLGAVFSGHMQTLFYSLGGGLLSFLFLCLFARLLGERAIWLTSCISAIVHNVGQLFVAAIFMRTSAVFFYLPYLIVIGAITGFFTGLTAQFVLLRMRKK